jgi:hypothetical protein
MSGFLQRIAAAAIRPEPKLRALLGSIYAGEPGMGFAEEKPSLPPDPPRPIRPEASSPEQIETHIPRPEPSPGETSVHHEPLVAARQPFPPSLASVVAQLTQPIVPTIYAPEHSGASTALSAQRSGRTDEPSQPPATPPASSSATPLSEPRLAQFMPIATHRELPQPAPSIAKQPSPHLAPGQKATNDEIQIHIGRIEVIAMPPPGTAAPAASRSRGTSLDDYLRRRNGRAG